MHLYNSLTRRKQLFKPLKPDEVKIYVCGITPYDTTHLGHAFTYVSFDALIRYLQFRGHKVIYTQNVTDIDDDILKRASETGQNWQELGDFWTNQFLSDMKSLNVQRPTYYVKATDSNLKIIEMVKKLIRKGVAYEKEGNVYFEIKKFPSYDKLSRLSKKQMLLISKERGNNPDDPLKKNPLDFVLWQKSSPGEPSWKSPWGEGRSGWHIECSAMINQYLGPQIDIHGGGKDLIYPHHESEIAQSEIYTGKKPFVKYWMHSAMVMCEGEKMSKSLGNLVMISDFLKKYPGNAIRFLILSNHYRKPWEFDKWQLEQAKRKAATIEKALSLNLQGGQKENKYTRKFIKIMDDDLDTPQALFFATKLAQKVLRTSGDQQKDMYQALKLIFTALGFKA